MHGQSRGRQFASIFALIIVVGGFAGGGAYIVTRTYLADAADAPQSNGAQGNGAQGNGAQSNAAGPTSGGNQGGGAQPGPSGASCPAFTATAVKNAGRTGDLKLVLYVDGTRDGTNGAEAWICQDSDGTLYYQGHNKDRPLTAATTDVSILIGPGVRGSVARQGSGFVATNPADGGTVQYVVTRETLTIVLPDGGRQEYRVVRSLPN